MMSRQAEHPKRLGTEVLGQEVPKYLPVRRRWHGCASAQSPKAELEKKAPWARRRWRSVSSPRVRYRPGRPV